MCVCVCVCVRVCVCVCARAKVIESLNCEILVLISCMNMTSAYFWAINFAADLGLLTLQNTAHYILQILIQFLELMPSYHISPCSPLPFKVVNMESVLLVIVQR